MTEGAGSKASQLFLPSLPKSDIDPDIIADIEPKSVSMIAVAEITEELFINQWQQSLNFFLFFFFLAIVLLCSDSSDLLKSEFTDFYSNPLNCALTESFYGYTKLVLNKLYQIIVKTMLSLFTLRMLLLTLIPY